MFTNLLYKAEKPSVRHTNNSAVLAWIEIGRAVFWHVHAYFEKFLTAVVCTKDRACYFNDH